MKEDQGLSTQVYGRSPTRDKLECGCEVNAQERIDTLGITPTTLSRKENKQENGYIKLPEQSVEEELGEEQQELKTREKKKKAKDAKRIRGTVHENDNNKGTSHVQDEMEKLVHHDDQELFSVREGWHWDDNKGEWLDLELCAKARRVEVEYIRRHKMYTRVSRETCLRETAKAPIKTRWAESDKGQPRKRNVRARWVANEYKTDARPELYASTSPLEALKVVPLEVATGERGGKLVALVDVRRAYLYAPPRR